MALIKCSECGKEISDKASSCPGCGCPIVAKEGIVKYSLFGGQKQVVCPRCGSIDCSHYKETVTRPAKTKTKYSANLNPLKPFTILNKKEKVVRKEYSYDVNMFLCNKCGYTFL